MFDKGSVFVRLVGHAQELKSALVLFGKASEDPCQRVGLVWPAVSYANLKRQRGLLSLPGCQRLQFVFVAVPPLKVLEWKPLRSATDRRGRRRPEATALAAMERLGICDRVAVFHGPVVSADAAQFWPVDYVQSSCRSRYLVTRCASCRQSAIPAVATKIMRGLASLALLMLCAQICRVAINWLLLSLHSQQ
jgi:hypothetical protein